MTFRQVRQISSILAGIGLGLWAVGLAVALLLPQRVETCLPFLFLALAVMIGDVVFLTRWWRCPHCGKSLPAAGVSIMAPTLAYCPHCGHPLHDDDMIS